MTRSLKVFLALACLATPCSAIAMQPPPGSFATIWDDSNGLSASTPVPTFSTDIPCEPLMISLDGTSIEHPGKIALNLDGIWSISSWATVVDISRLPISASAPSGMFRSIAEMLLRNRGHMDVSFYFPACAAK